MSTKQKDSILGIIFSLILTCTNEGESKEGSQSLRFWRLMPKGEKVLAQSKRTAPPPNFKIGDFQLVNFKLVKGGESSISKMVYQNPLEH